MIEWGKGFRVKESFRFHIEKHSCARFIVLTMPTWASLAITTHLLRQCCSRVLQTTGTLYPCRSGRGYDLHLYHFHRKFYGRDMCCDHNGLADVAHAWQFHKADGAESIKDHSIYEDRSNVMTSGWKQMPLALLLRSGGPEWCSLR